MLANRVLTAMIALSLLAGNVWGADIILNEYNAVDSNDFVGGGNAAADENGGRASDSYFGRAAGNGGDWFELVVIKDHLDVRGWHLDILEDGVIDETLTLTIHPIWKDLRAGTIVTVSEEVASDISYDPAAGDWWINVRANNNGDGLYIEKSSFPVSSKNWQLRIRNIAGQVVFGPAGEGISPASGISGTEVFRLEENPSETILAESPNYDDGDDFSTFGAPNRWGGQSFDKLRAVVPPALASIKVLAPNGAEILVSDRVSDIEWQSEGIDEDVLVEFSVDHGLSWNAVYPPNIGNAGRYRWLVPLVDSSAAQVRVSSATRPAVSDHSDAPFTILNITPVADLSHGGRVDFSALARLAAAWLN